MHKCKAVKPLHALRPRLNFKQHAALQSSELASRVPGSTVQQQVRVGEVLQNAAVYLLMFGTTLYSLQHRFFVLEHFAVTLLDNGDVVCTGKFTGSTVQ